jgi:hypothetical protein
MQDARTFVYESFGATMVGVSRADYVKEVTDSGRFVLPNGIMPLFAFEATVKSSSKVTGLKSGVELESRFRAAVENVLQRTSSENIKRFMSLIETYQRLYAARTAYDIYEYFGCYAFLRHFLTLKCAAAMKFEAAENAQIFRYAAATYQFGKALEILENTHLN